MVVQTPTFLGLPQLHEEEFRRGLLALGIVAAGGVVRPGVAVALVLGVDGDRGGGDGGRGHQEAEPRPHRAADSWQF